MCNFIKTTSIFLLGLTLLSSVLGCDGTIGVKRNPDDTITKATKENKLADTSKKVDLREIIFRDIKEISAFSAFEEMGAILVDVNSPDGDEFAINHIANDRNSILIFEKIVRIPGEPKVKYQILDTIVLANTKDNEYFSLGLCKLGSTYDPEIIALVLAEHEKEFYDKVVKAWRADTKTEKIVLLNDHSKITCANEGFGLEDCGDNDNISESDTTEIKNK